MKKIMIAGLITLSCAALFSAAVSAQQNFGRMGGRGGMRGEGQRMYDPSQAEIVSGEVIAVKDIEAKKGKMSGVGLELNADGQTLLVYLGPHIYVDLQNIRVSAGDNVEIKGVRVVIDGQQALIAGEVRKGGEVLQLRDNNGTPLWAGTQGGRGK